MYKKNVQKENIWNIPHQQNRSGSAAYSWGLEIFAVTTNNQGFIVFLKAPTVCNFLRYKIG